MVAAEEKTEINCQRLLSRCKALAQQHMKRDLWRLDKYVEKLDQLLKFAKDIQRIRPDVLSKHMNELAFLKSLLDIARKESSDEQITLCQMVPVPAIDHSTSETHRKKDNLELQHIKMRNVSLYAADMRRELLGPDCDTGIRLRSVGDGVLPEGASDVDVVLSHHNKLQEKLADEFLQLTRNLKENVAIAGHVIKDDTKTVLRIDKEAEKNRTELEREAKRLEKFAYESCDWWVWIMLLIVLISFVFMVLFMRIFSK